MWGKTMKNHDQYGGLNGKSHGKDGSDIDQLNPCVRCFDPLGILVTSPQFLLVFFPPASVGWHQRSGSGAALRSKVSDHDWLIPHRIHGAAIYGNIYHHYTPNVSIYTILHGFFGYTTIDI
jgi:hypothetical protein